MRASSLPDRQKLALELLSRVKTELADKRPAARQGESAPAPAATDANPPAATDPSRTTGRLSRNV